MRYFLLFFTYLTLIINPFCWCGPRPDFDEPEKLYLELIKRCISNNVFYNYIETNYWLYPQVPFFPTLDQTMIGYQGLDALQSFMETVIEENIPGDFVETGVWRGGTTIFMRAFLKAKNITNRKVWVADSFAGLPPPNLEKYPLDENLDLSSITWLAVSLAEVQKNFARYGLLDTQVVFLKGWFSETLPKAPIDKLAIMRLDGDLYESTLDALNNLYSKLQIGGYCIIDDYGAIASCAQAVHDFRKAHDITDPIYPIDWTEAYWRKSK